MLKRKPSRRVFIRLGILLLFGASVAPHWAVTKKWVGHTDLEIRFVVSDAETGRAIPNATIHIFCEHRDFCDECEQPDFTITTDSQGSAEYLSKNCTCAGSKGVFEDTYGVYLPSWLCDVSARGYADTGPEYLDMLANGRDAQRGTDFATIAIPIQLHRPSSGQFAIAR